MTETYVSRFGTTNTTLRRTIIFLSMKYFSSDLKPSVTDILGCIIEGLYREGFQIFDAQSVDLA